MVGADRRTVVLRHRAAMAGDNPFPVHLYPNHEPLSMRDGVVNTQVGLVLPVASPSASYRHLTVDPRRALFLCQ